MGRLAAPWPRPALGRGRGALRCSWSPDSRPPLRARFADGPGRHSPRHAPRPAMCSCIRCGTSPCLAPAARPMLSARVRRVQVYYFFVKTKMSGFFQTVFYFGYSAPPPLASLCCGPGPALPRCHSRACRCNGSVDFLRGPRRDVRHFGLLRLLRLRSPHLREYQVGLTLATRSPTTGSCAFGLRTSRVQGGGRAGVRLCRPT